MASDIIKKMKIILLILILIIIIFSIKNIVLIKDLIISKEYRKIYKAVIAEEADIIARLESYIINEKNKYLLSKAYVLLMYVKLHSGLDVLDEIEKINYNDIFLKNGKYNKKFVNLNSDMFIWTLASMPLLYKQGHLPPIQVKIIDLEDRLNNHIEYKVFKACNAMLSNNSDGYQFLYDLVNGDYASLDYDKKLIGATKRVALAYLGSLKKENNIEYADELKYFSTTMIGRKLLTDLEIFEIYK